MIAAAEVEGSGAGASLRLVNPPTITPPPAGSNETSAASKLSRPKLVSVGQCIDRNKRGWDVDEIRM
jgi:hypothetical protein